MNNIITKCLVCCSDFMQNKSSVCPYCNNKLIHYLKYYLECRKCKKKPIFNYNLQKSKRIILDIKYMSLIMNSEKLETEENLCFFCNNELSENVIEYAINEYLILKKEKGAINIYIKNKKFIKCKYLLINIPNKTYNYLIRNSNINSIDEILNICQGRTLSKANEFNKSIIDLDSEFWGHCSNLEAWYRNNYNSGILKYNLSFPLLRELVKNGDPLAKEVYLKEIIKRLNSDKNVATYLFKEGFLLFFKKKELDLIRAKINDDEIKKKVLKYKYLVKWKRCIFLIKKSIKKLRKYIIKGLIMGISFFLSIMGIGIILGIIIQVYALFL